jgi:Abortive infection C-terminus
MRIFDDAFDMHGGYVLNFSDRTMSEFFDDEFQISLDEEKYRLNGGSKAKRLRTFIAAEDEFVVGRVLRRLWEHRESIPILVGNPNSAQIKQRFFTLLEKIEGASVAPSTDAIDRFRRDETLDELIEAINRDIAANKPVAAIDRLHTYCLKKFGHLLEKRGITCDRAEPLHSRVGKYVKTLQQERELRDMTLQSIKSAFGVFEKFNHVRNNQSLAHDNELLDAVEARFLYDTVTAFLRFVKSIEATQFD